MPNVLELSGPARAARDLARWSEVLGRTALYAGAGLDLLFEHQVDRPGLAWNHCHLFKFPATLRFHVIPLRGA